MKGKGKYNSIKARQQQGVILVVCLVFLVVLTVMAVGGMETTIVEERMAGNMQDHFRAFQAAEVSLEGAESWLDNRVLLPEVSTNGSTIVWVSDAPDPDSDNEPWWLERTDTWWDGNAVSMSGMSEVTDQPQYLIEEYFSGFRGNDLSIGTGDAPAERVMHRITALGIGANENTQVLLQTTYIRPYD